MPTIVEIYTDGACKGNPGPGGWGVLLRYGEVEKELSGYEYDTTNNRMELLAAIKGLEALKRHSVVHVHTDSTYVKDGITKWIHAWKKKGWKVEDVSMIKGGCDFKFSKDNEVVYCEVKGTTTAGESIILTSREVEKMKERYPNSALYVVYGIRLDKSKDPPVATFGSVKKKYPWEIKDNKLKAKDYYYET